MSEKTCFDCEHMYYSRAEPTWSELTPGWDAEMYCAKSHWQFDAYNDDKSQVRAKIYTARACPDFAPEAQK